MSPTWTESRLAASRRCFLLAQAMPATFRRFFPLARPVLAGGPPRNHTQRITMGCSGVGLAGGFVCLQAKSSHPENPTVIAPGA